MEAVGLLVQDLGDRADRLLALVVCDLQHRPLGLLHELTWRAGAVEHVGLDLPRRVEQRPHLRLLAHDPAVVARVAGGRHPGDQLLDHVRAADLIEPVVLPQLLGDGEVVDLLVALVELEHRLEHRAVLAQVEVLGAQLLVHQQRVQVLLVEQHRTQHRLLGDEVVGGGGGGGAHQMDVER